MSQLDSALELGKLYYDRGEFVPAIEHLNSAATGYFAEKDFSQYLKCLNMLLRIYAEREQFEDINSAKEKLQDLVGLRRIKRFLDSRLLYLPSDFRGRQSIYKYSL